jgi:serine/threonine protein kinase
MNIQINQENLVIQEKGNPSKKYKPTKMLGSGSFGIVYEAENSIFQNTVAMKVINLTKFVYLISMSIIGLAKKLI